MSGVNDTLADIMAQALRKYDERFPDGSPGGPGSPGTAAAADVVADMRRGRLRAWGVPQRALEASLGRLEQSPAIEALAQFPLSRGPCLALLMGIPGTGKTVAGAWWLERRMAEASSRRDLGPPMFVTADRFSTWSAWGPETKDAMAARALVLDDLGVDYADEKGYFRSKLDALINARYSDVLPTVMTTNLSLPDFAARVPERVMSRLREAGTMVTLTRSFRR